MNASNRELLKILEHDDSLTQAERVALRQLRRGEPITSTGSTADKILRRRDVAARCGCGIRTVDRWAKLGILPRVKLPGFVRASGIPESAVQALIAGSAATPVHCQPPGAGKVGQEA